MKSQAHIQSHPIHPILIGFPITFFVATLVCDVAVFLNAAPSLIVMARYLNIAGIVSGLLAAIPGFIDFIYTVPARSSGKRRAAIHGTLNTVVIALFGIALWLRAGAGEAWLMVVLAELVAVVLMSCAGWMGGTLVYRNQIGVDVRYADAGKWSELSVEARRGKLEVAAAGELGINQMKLIRVGEERVVLARTDAGYVAFEDRCPHRGGSLAGGAMICGTVQCPWHGSQFDVRSGELRAGPAKEGIQTFEVLEEGAHIYLNWTGD